MGRFVEELILREIPDPLPHTGWVNVAEQERYALIHKLEDQNEEAIREAILADYKYDTIMDAIDKIEGIVDKVMDGVMQIAAHNAKPAINITITASNDAAREEIKQAVLAAMSEAVNLSNEEANYDPVNIEKEVKPKTVNPGKKQVIKFEV